MEATRSPVRTGASRRLRENGSVRIPDVVLATAFEEEAAAPAGKTPAPGAEKPAEAAGGQLGLADWMNLAYTLSTMWKRACSGAAAPDRS